MLAKIDTLETKLDAEKKKTASLTRQLADSRRFHRFGLKIAQEAQKILGSDVKIPTASGAFLSTANQVTPLKRPHAATGPNVKAETTDL